MLAGHERNVYNQLKWIFNGVVKIQLALKKY
jgi:hypothetical protein